MKRLILCILGCQIIIQGASSQVEKLRLPKKKAKDLESCVKAAYGPPSRIEYLKPDMETSLTSGYALYYGGRFKFVREVFLGGVYESLYYEMGSIKDGIEFLKSCFTNLDGKAVPSTNVNEFEYKFQRDFLHCLHKVTKNNGKFIIISGCQS